MDKESTVIRNLVVPLERYTKLKENQTMHEAIEAFNSLRQDTQNRLLCGKLLVVNEQNQLVGKLSMVDILHGLAPRLMDASKIDKFEGREAEYPNLAFLYEDSTFATCGENQLKPIKPLMKAIDFSLPADTHILKALVMMSHRNDYNVPVTDDGEIIGILSLEEVFNAMCNTYCAIK